MISKHNCYNKQSNVNKRQSKCSKQFQNFYFIHNSDSECSFSFTDEINRECGNKINFIGKSNINVSVDDKNCIVYIDGQPLRKEIRNRTGHIPPVPVSDDPNDFILWKSQIQDFDQIVLPIYNDSIFLALESSNTSNPPIFYNADGATASNIQNNLPFSLGQSNKGSKVTMGKVSSTGIWEWVVAVDGSSLDSNPSVTTDSQGNSYLSLNYFGIPIFYNADGATAANIQNNLPASVGSSKVTMGKISSQGEWKWVVVVDGSGSEQNPSIATDSQGNSYLTLYSSSNLPFFFNADGATAANNIQNNLPSPVGSSKVIMGKVSSLGEWQWVVAVDGTSSEQFPDISTDLQGNSYLTLYSLSASVPPIFFNADGSTASNIQNNLPSSLSQNDKGSKVTMGKVSSTGMWEWVIAVDGAGDDQHSSVAIDSQGNSYLTLFSTSASIPPIFYNADGSTAANIQNNLPDYLSEITPYNKVTMGKVSSTGMWEWVVAVDGVGGSDEYPVVSTDSQGNSYLTLHSFSIPPIFFNADGSTASNIQNNLPDYLSQNNSYKVTMGKVSSTGMWEWVVAVDGVVNEQYPSIATDSQGNSYLTLSSDSTPPIFYNVDGTTATNIQNNLPTSLSQNNLRKVTMGKVSSTGMWEWVVAVDGNGNDTLSSIATNSSSYQEVSTNCQRITSSIQYFIEVLNKKQTEGNSVWDDFFAQNPTFIEDCQVFKNNLCS